MKSWCPWVARAGFHGGVAQQECRWHIRAERRLGSPLPRSPLIDKMVRVLVLLSLVCCATAQFGFFQGRGPQRRPQQRRPQGQNQLRQGGGGVDDRHGQSEYHFSWRHDGGRDYTGQQAFGYCSGLGGGWSPVSINDGSEDNFVNSVIRGERQKYIWTGGSKRGGGWAWADGSGVQGINWSHTGGNQRPQPDNRDRNEDCLAVLNNFYGDGIKWHDVGCSHRKPTICERRG